MKISLINPNFRHLITRVEQYFTTPFSLPLGIAYLAGYLQMRGHQVQVIDAHAENLSVAKTIKRIKSYQPQAAGFSAHSSADCCAVLAKELKLIDHNCTTIIGGVVASLLSAETMNRYPVFDFLIQGEGEVAFSKLLEALDGGGGVECIPSLVYRQNQEIVINGQQEMVCDLDTLAFPARELFNNQLYRYWPRLSSNVETLIAASRGCSAGHCDFCCIGKMFGTHLRKRSPENVADEIELCLTRHSIRNFSFIDSTFTHDREFVYQITDCLEKRGLHKKIKWWCSTRVDRIDIDMLQKMKSAGCVAISFGVEFGSQHMLDFFNKGINLAETEKAFRLAKASGIWTTAYVMLNQYSEHTYSMVKQTQDFITRIKPDLLRISPLIVTPGTQLFDCLQEKHAFSSADYSSYLRGEYIESQYITSKSLEKVKQKIYFNYYLHPDFVLSKLKGFFSRT